MTMVRKNSGNKEPFDEDKIKRSIQKAAIDAGVTLEDVSTEVADITDMITQIAREKKEINSHAIKDHVLKELDKSKPPVAESWRKFDEKYKD
jgi:transcriptional repressor NrdR